jgi:hypothetical protein
MKTTKQPYQSPDVFRRRVFLEENIATKASILISAAGNIQQNNWTSVTDEAVGAGMDTQGDVWFVY